MTDVTNEIGTEYSTESALISHSNSLRHLRICCYPLAMEFNHMIDLYSPFDTAEGTAGQVKVLLLGADFVCYPCYVV